jgi:hypothetical protein
MWDRNTQTVRRFDSFLSMESKNEQGAKTFPHGKWIEKAEGGNILSFRFY